MKKLFILLLLFSVSCKDSSDTGGSDSTSESTTNPVTNVETPASPAPTPAPGAPVPSPTSPTTPSTTDAWTEEFMDLVNNPKLVR